MFHVEHHDRRSRRIPSWIPSSANPAARSVAGGHRSAAGCGGSLTRTIPPGRSNGEAAAISTAGAAKLPRRDHIELAGALGADVASLAGDHLHLRPEPQGSDRPAEQVGSRRPALDEHDVQVRAAMGDDQPRQAAAGTEIGQVARGWGDQRDEAVGVGDGGRQRGLADRPPLADPAQGAEQRLVSQRWGR